MAGAARSGGAHRGSPNPFRPEWGLEHPRASQRSGAAAVTYLGAQGRERSQGLDGLRARPGQSAHVSSGAGFALARAPGLSPSGHAPSRLRPRPPPAPRCADVTAPRQPMAVGNLRPAARPPPFKSGSLRLSELRVGRAKPRTLAGTWTRGVLGRLRLAARGPGSRMQPQRLGNDSPSEASLIQSSDQTRITPASSLPGSVPTGDGSPRRRSAPLGTSFQPRLKGEGRRGGAGPEASPDWV